MHNAIFPCCFHTVLRNADCFISLRQNGRHEQRVVCCDALCCVVINICVLHSESPKQQNQKPAVHVWKVLTDVGVDSLYTPPLPFVLRPPCVEVAQGCRRRSEAARARARRETRGRSLDLLDCQLWENGVCFCVLARRQRKKAGVHNTAGASTK